MESRVTKTHSSAKKRKKYPVILTHTSSYILPSIVVGKGNA
jgi:hypothetical protein